MNAIVEYAIFHQDASRRILRGVYGVPPSDVEDVAQDAILRVLQAAPRHMDYPDAYWRITLRSAAMTYWQRRKVFPLASDPADPRQDPETLAIQREALREAYAVARPAERAALSDYARGVHTSNRSRVAMHRLRRRLQAAVTDGRAT